MLWGDDDDRGHVIRWMVKLQLIYRLQFRSYMDVSMYLPKPCFRN